jgi:sugar/nucleoside kinase (ribokinase family)
MDMSGNRPPKDVDVLCVGMIVHDVLGKPIDQVPEWDRLATFKEVEHNVGGCAVNTGVNLVRLTQGRLKVAIVGCVGCDGPADFVRQRLAEERLDVGAVVQTGEAATSYTFVMIGSHGRRRYFHLPGANAFLRDSDVPDHLLDRSRILHIGGALLLPMLDGEPSATLLRRAKDRGVVTFMDTAYNPNTDSRILIEPCARHLDVFIPSLEEAELITGKTTPGEILDSLSEFRIPLLGVKLGADGCLIRSQGQTRHYRAYSVGLVDSTGAGDAFMAGFIYATIREWPIDRRARFANAVAAHCIGSVGCSNGIPPAENVCRFMESTAPHQEESRPGFGEARTGEDRHPGEEPRKDHK